MSVRSIYTYIIIYYCSGKAQLTFVHLPTRTMSGIDPSSGDKGLRKCLQDADTAPELIELLLDKEGFTRWKNLSQFFYYFEPDSLSSGIEAILALYPQYKKAGMGERPNHFFQREQAHLREAWHTAKREVAELETIAPDQDIDWEAPLPQHTHDEMQSKWMQRYNFSIRPEFNPDQTTVTRYFRALTKNKISMKVVEMVKHKPVGTTTGLEKSASKTINSLYEWYVHGRTMAYALALAGNHMVKCKELGETIMAPLDVLQNYVDEAYELGLARQSLAWLKERDELTRTLMVDHMKNGYSVGAALLRAREKAAFHWQDATLFKDRLKPGKGGGGAPTYVPDPKLKGLDSNRRPTDPQPGQGKNWLKKQKQRQRRLGRNVGGDDARSSQRDRERSRTPRRASDRDQSGRPSGKKPIQLFCPSAKGKQTCEYWNMGQRCKDGKDCIKLHNYCSRRLLKGGACGQNHQAYKCTNPDRVRDPDRRSPIRPKQKA